MSVEQEENYRQLLIQISSFGTEQKHKEANALIEMVPINSLLTVAIKQFKDSRPDFKLFDKEKPTLTAIRNITDTLIKERSAKRLKALMDCTKTDMLLAHHIGTPKLLVACRIFDEQKNSDLNNRNSMNKMVTGGPTRKTFSNNLVFIREFTQRFTPWLLCFPPKERFLHSKKASFEVVNEHSKRLILQLAEAQISALHMEINSLSSKGEVLDCTSIGDVALSFFVSIKLKYGVNSAVLFIERLVKTGQAIDI